MPEASRHRLHTKLSTRLGSEDATVLMEHLPPVGWADIATKRDLDHLETVLRSELQTAIADLRSEVHRLQASFTRQLLLANTAMVGVFAALLQLTR